MSAGLEEDFEPEDDELAQELCNRNMNAPAPVLHPIPRRRLKVTVARL